MKEDKKERVALEGPNPDFRSKFHQTEGQAKESDAKNESVNHPRIKADSEAHRNNDYRLPHPENEYGKLSGFNSPRPKGAEGFMAKQKKNQGMDRNFDQEV